jgi:2-dehydro-3-deoxyphosphooctonate aldolase (KDO 8-P synthase)
MPQPRTCRVGYTLVAPGRPLTIIAGPCVLESLELGLSVARAVHDACKAAGLPYVFKASFDKANRSSIRSPRGPGLEQGLEWMQHIARELNVPVTTDIHEPAQAEPVARAVDLLQIPAFLCRQTDLLLAAGQAAAAHARAVNVKKGQFLSPHEMRGAVTKLAEAGCTNVMLTERGTTFGYGRLVNDFIGLGDLMELDAPGGPPPVCFDCTHSTQAPGLGAADTTGGRPERAPLLARAAVAAGVSALFMEVHTDPRHALSDAATQLTIPAGVELVKQVAAIHKALTT